MLAENYSGGYAIKAYNNGSQVEAIHAENTQMFGYGVKSVVTGSQATAIMGLANSATASISGKNTGGGGVGVYGLADQVAGELRALVFAGDDFARSTPGSGHRFEEGLIACRSGCCRSDVSHWRQSQGGQAADEKKLAQIHGFSLAHLPATALEFCRIMVNGWFPGWRKALENQHFRRLDSLQAA